MENLFQRTRFLRLQGEQPELVCVFSLLQQLVAVRRDDPDTLGIQSHLIKLLPTGEAEPNPIFSFLLEVMAGRFPLGGTAEMRELSQFSSFGIHIYFSKEFFRKRTFPPHTHECLVQMSQIKRYIHLCRGYLEMCSHVQEKIFWKRNRIMGPLLNSKFEGVLDTSFLIIVYLRPADIHLKSQVTLAR